VNEPTCTPDIKLCAPIIFILNSFLCDMCLVKHKERDVCLDAMLTI